MKNIVLFGHERIYVDHLGKGEITGVFVPAHSRYRRFGDITAPNKASVKERYGDASDSSPLWRQDGPYVDVYDYMPEELEQRKNAFSAYLPQDFAPKGCKAFFYVIGDKWVVHGVSKVSDDQKVSWGTSLIDLSGLTVKDAIVNSISELLLANLASDEFCVAVDRSPEVSVELENALKDFDVSVQEFSKLIPSSEVKPIYKHRDFSLLMITVAMMAMLCLVALSGYYVIGLQELEKERNQVAIVEHKLRSLAEKNQLPNVKNPQGVLSQIRSKLSVPPSSFLHAVGELAQDFGDISKISYVNTVDGASSGRRSNSRRFLPGDKIFELDVLVDSNDAELLVHQETVAKSRLSNRPWIRYIERGGAARSALNLKVGVQVE